MIFRTPREIVLMMARELDPQESAPEDYEYIHEWVPEHSCGGAGDPTCAACWMHDFDRCLTAHDAEVRASVVAEVSKPQVDDGHDGWCGCERCVSEQGEPSDAQVRAAQEVLAKWRPMPESVVRDALRAAMSLREEGVG